MSTIVSAVESAVANTIQAAHFAANSSSFLSTIGAAQQTTLGAAYDAANE